MKHMPFRPGHSPNYILKAPSEAAGRMAAPIQGLGGPACLTPARCSVYIRHFLPPLYRGHTGLCFLNRLTLLLSESLLLTDFFFLI